MADTKPPSLYEIIERVLARVPGPMPIDEAVRALRATGPQPAVRFCLGG
jgi:hypothetical protein